jgi:formylglycine-generating enzyme required for sulfatase activity
MAYKAFVASTFKDLKDHRAHVINALEYAGFSVDPMEKWPASAEEPKVFSPERVAGSSLCVLLVGWRRGFVPEGEQLSITQIEYKAAREQNIDVLIYILDDRAKWEREWDELDKDPEIKRWRAELAPIATPFNEKPESINLAPALTRWVDERPKRSGGTLPPNWLKEHLAALQDQLRYIAVPLAGKHRTQRVELQGVYVPLKLQMLQRSPESQQPGWTSLLKLPRVALTGDAGSGKSTLLRYIALEMAKRAGDQQGAPPPPTMPGTVSRIPVYLNLARESGELLPKGASDAESVSIPHRQWLPLFASLLRLAEAQAEAVLRQGNLLLLLDGLDEVATTRERELLVDAIINLQRQYSPIDLQNHVIVCCREAAWAAGEPYALFDKVFIRPMDRDTTNLLLENWSRAVWGDEASRITKGLERSLTSPAVRDLAANPQLGTLLALVEYEGDAPRQEATLFEQFVRKLGKVKEGSVSTDRTRAQLIALAVEMQRSTGPGSEPLNAMRLQEARLLLAKKELPPNTTVSKQELSERGERLVRRLEIRTGMLDTDRTAGVGAHRAMVRFRHRTFQEYLAACYFAEQGVEELLKHVMDPAWSKVLALACGVLTGIDQDDVRRLLERILATPDFPTNGDLPAATLVEWAPRVAAASACLAELASYDLDDATLEPARRAHNLILPLLASRDRRVDTHTRTRIADGLGSIFDPRLRPALRWVSVPPGSLVRGSEAEEAWLQEKPRAKLRLQEFRIQRWPVTTGDYQVFLEQSNGYETDEWWQDEEGRRWRDANGIKAPLGWDKNRAVKNRPVTGVSWWEARAYCRWYTGVNSGLPDGWKAELPLEAQWEMAARGAVASARDAEPCSDADEHPFPWGTEWLADAANSAATGIQHIVAVGLFPAGHSPYELWDMAGNISEHCLDAFGAYDADGHEVLPDPDYSYGSTVRGGSFASQPLDLRVTYRFGLNRDVQDEHVGFRCAGVPEGALS